MVESGSRPAEAAGLRIDAVEVLPTDLRSVLLRVAGAWEGPPPKRLDPPVLVLRGPGGVHRIDALPETSGAAARAAPEVQPFRAAFSVPDALAPLLDDAIELDLGPLTVRLPVPTALGGDAGAGQAEGTVVDRAVLAERRARRAELAEETNLQRAGEAEQTAATLEGELAKLELRLAATAQEQAELEARLAEREREARDARQRAHAEQRLREEATVEGRRRAEAAEDEAAELRERLREAADRVGGLDRELETMRRRADEAQQAVAASASAERIVAKRQRELEARQHALDDRAEAVATAEVETATAREDLRRAMARAGAMRLELEGLRREVLEQHRLTAPPPPDVPALETAERAIVEAREVLGAAQAEFERDRAELASAHARIADLERELGAVAADRDALAAGRDRLVAERARIPRRGPRTSTSPWLGEAMRRLARADEVAAGRLALQLLPGQGLAAARPLDYDVELAGVGRYRVTVRPGAGELVAPASPRPRGAGFRVLATPAGLVALVVDGGAERPAGVRVAGTLRRRRALGRLPAVPLRLGALARAAVLPDPSLLYRALAAAMDPGWTRGHRFTVALEVAGPRGGRWYVTAADGAPVTVGEPRPDVTVDATVRTSQIGLQHLLDGEVPPAGEKAVMRGDATALGLLGQWADWARRLGGGGAP